MFSPYTHYWPMTHQPVYPHSKPLLHYLNRQASCWKVGGQTPGSSSFIISPYSHKRRTHDLNCVHSSKMPHMLWILPAWRTKRNSSLLFRFAGLAAVFAAAAVWQSTELLEDWRHSIEIVNVVTLSVNWYVSAQSCIINCFRWCKRECSLSSMSILTYSWRGPWQKKQLTNNQFKDDRLLKYTHVLGVSN